MQALRFAPWLAPLSLLLTASRGLSPSSIGRQAEGCPEPCNRNQTGAATTGVPLPANSSNACTAFAAYISDGPPPI